MKRKIITDLEIKDILKKIDDSRDPLLIFLVFSQFSNIYSTKKTAEGDILPPKEVDLSCYIYLFYKKETISNQRIFCYKKIKSFMNLKDFYNELSNSEIFKQKNNQFGKNACPSIFVSFKEMSKFSDDLGWTLCEILNTFEGKENYKNFHLNKKNKKYNFKLINEDIPINYLWNKESMYPFSNKESLLKLIGLGIISQIMYRMNLCKNALDQRNFCEINKSFFEKHIPEFQPYYDYLKKYALFRQDFVPEMKEFPFFMIKRDCFVQKLRSENNQYELAHHLHELKSF